MKRILGLCLFLYGMVVLLASSPVMAKEEVQLFLNGTKLKSAISAAVSDDILYAPAGLLSEHLGMTVSFGKDDKQLTINGLNHSLKLKLDQLDAEIDGAQKKLPAAPFLQNGNPMVPLRYVGEQLGIRVIWDGLTQSAFMYKQLSSGETPSTPTPITPGTGGSVGGNNGGNTGNTGNTSGNPGVIAAIQSIGLNGSQITINADQPIQAAPFYLINPDRVVVDVPNSVLGNGMNKSGVIQVNDIYIDQIRYSNYSNNPATVRIVIQMKQKMGYSLSNNGGKQLSILVKPVLYKVVLDPGHGGTDPGAGSITGKAEKNFTLSLTGKIKDLLAQEPSIDVNMTRQGDTYPELDERVAFANQMNADIFISIHGNSSENASVKGTESYYWRTESLSLAETLHKHVIAATGFTNRGVKKNNFRVITTTVMPAVLLEIGYLSNVSDEAQMYTDEFQNRVAKEIVAGIKEYLGISTSGS